MSPQYNPGPIGVPRATAPAHRRAQGWTGDQAIQTPLTIRSGRLMIELGEGLSIVDGKLAMKVSGATAAAWKASDRIGVGLEADEVFNIIELKQGAALTTLADDGLTLTSPNPTQAEVQDIADKLDALIGILETAEHLET